MKVERKHPKMMFDPIKFCEMKASEGSQEEREPFEKLLNQVNIIPEVLLTVHLKNHSG